MISFCAVLDIYNYFGRFFFCFLQHLIDFFLSSVFFTSFFPQVFQWLSGSRTFVCFSSWHVTEMIFFVKISISLCCILSGQPNCIFLQNIILLIPVYFICCPTFACLHPSHASRCHIGLAVCVSCIVNVLHKLRITFTL